MYPLNLLIKPASGYCNFKCKYCFYEDVAHNREVQSYGFMSTKTLEQIVKKALKFAKDECTFTFQGGEPTLVGLDFYKDLIKFQKKYNKKGLKIHNSIQTNGYLIDKEWAKFLHNNNFLVGISLDGTKEINDINRIDANKEGTYDKILETIGLFNKYKVEYNILTVVTSYVAKNIRSVYEFYKEKNFSYQQYIPYLDPICEKRGNREYSLTPKLYGEFLKDLFDLWYEDITNGRFVYNRYFENIVGIIKGFRPEACGMIGHCTLQNVIEADGSVYPCDFYVLDEQKIGNLIEMDFEDIERKRNESKFIETSLKVEDCCMECKWKNLCRGGCRRDRDENMDGNLSVNYFCESYKEFFEYAIDRLVKF